MALNSEANTFNEVFGFLKFKRFPQTYTKNQKDVLRRRVKKFKLGEDDTLYYLSNGKELIVVRDDSQYQKVFEECHSSATGAHLGRDKTMSRVRERYYWPGCYSFIAQKVKECDRCQRSANATPSTAPPLQIVPVTSDVWMKIGMDVFNFKESADGFKHVITITDYFSKWVEAVAVQDKTAKTIADFLIKTILRNGAPRILVTDNGSEFKNHTMQQLTSMYGIHHIFTTPYHPQANGLDERTNQTIKQSLRKLVHDNQADWPNYIDYVVSAINMTSQSSTGYSPIYLRELRIPRMGLQNQLEPCTEEAEGNISRAQAKQKADYDKRHNIIRHSFNINDKVLLQNLRRKTKKGHKDEEKWLGPYTITKMNKSGVYTLICSTGKQIKRHGSQLKPYISGDAMETSEPSSATSNASLEEPALGTIDSVSSSLQDPAHVISNSSTVSSSLQDSAKNLMDEISNDAGHHVIMGDVHQGEHPFSRDLAAGSQCSTMAYTSVLYASLTNICSWSADDVNHVMLQGHIMHTNQLTFLDRNLPESDHRLAIDELPEHPTILYDNTPFSFEVDMSAPTYFLFNNFQTELTKILQKHVNADGFLIRFGDYTTAIICHDDHYHLFDSHARDANGFPDQAGKAVVIYFPNVLSLCKHFRRFAFYRGMVHDQQIDVFPLQVHRPVSSAEENLHLLADVISGHDNLPLQTPVQIDSSQCQSKNTSGTDIHGFNVCSPRTYCLRQDPPAKRFSNSWETNLKLTGRRQKAQNARPNKDFFSFLPDNVLCTILSYVCRSEADIRSIALVCCRWNMMVPYLRDSLTKSCLQSMLGNINVSRLQKSHVVSDLKVYPLFPPVNCRSTFLDDATLSARTFDDNSSYPLDPVTNTTPVFLNDLTNTFAFILSKVGIHVPCDQSRSFLLMNEVLFQVFSEWRDSNISHNRLISDYIYTWHIKTRTPMRRIGNIVVMDHDQMQAYSGWLESFNDVRQYQHFQNPMDN